SLVEAIEKRRRQIAFGEGRYDDHDGFALIFGPAAYDDGGLQCRPRRYADGDALEPCNQAGIGECVVVRNRNHLVIDGSVEDLWREASADTLYLVGTRRSTGKHR